MKIKHFLTAFYIVVFAIVVAIIVYPYLSQLQSFKDECMGTQQGKLTPAEREKCKPKGTVKVIIPGVL